MSWLLFQVLLLQVILPFILLAWLARTQLHARIAWLLKTVIVLSYLLSAAVASVWLIVPWYIAYFYLITAVLLAAHTGLRARDKPWFVSLNSGSSLRISGLLVIMMVTVALTAYLFTGWIHPAGPQINLSFPLQQGSYYVINGGSNAALNPHMKTLSPDKRFTPWRGQSYGIDIVKINHWGLRTDGIQPSEPERYEIYGDSLISPCAGKVVRVENDRPQMPVPIRDPDRNKLAGNYVLLDCDGTEILMAHLQRGSITIKAEDVVDTGDFLGLIGNTGNTTEPHLHISAQRRIPGQPLIGGEPVVIFFSSDYLVRNERVKNDLAAYDRKDTQPFID